MFLKKIVAWETFRRELKAVWHKPDEERKSKAGRKPWDEVVMFKLLVLQQLYNLSDEQIEHQIRDRLSFMRFLDLGIENPVPDATIVWLYREKLAEAGLVKTLFDHFDAYLRDSGYLAMGGQIDASVVPVPRQRNTREENERIKQGETPEEWAKKPHKRRQKDVDARWTKKHGKSYFGYKACPRLERGTMSTWTGGTNSSATMKSPTRACMTARRLMT